MADFVKTKDSRDFSEVTRSVIDFLRLTYSSGIVPRISDIFTLLKDSFGIKEFELLDHRQIVNGPFESYVLDRYIDFLEGRPVNFTELFEDILKVGDFTAPEKTLLSEGNPEERLWAIFLVVSGLCIN